MNLNETMMKDRGEARVWSAIVSNRGGLKKIAATQIGQQIIFDDALRILPDLRQWISEGCAKVYRKELLEYFIDDEFLLQKTTEMFLYLVGTIHTEKVTVRDKRPATRHKKIASIKTKLMPELSFDQVWRFLEVAVSFSEYFEVEKNLINKENSSMWSMKYSCTLGEIIAGKLALAAVAAFFPEPMITPPIDWSWNQDDGIKGGYIHFQYDLIRATSKIQYKKYSQAIFDTANYAQSQPWKVNAEVVKQIGQDLQLPLKEDFIKTPYPSDEGCDWSIKLNDQTLVISEIKADKLRAIRTKFREQSELYNAEAGDFESAIGKYRAVKLALKIAERFIDEEYIYFPHSYDFRGRIYPLPVGLSPQGSDAVKAMLQYADGEVLTQDGQDWCWSFLASLYGDDKIPFAQRIERGKELLYTDYKEADEPYQFLAHQLEMQKYVEDTDRLMSIRIHLDACNSGSQFTSAITGDRSGCKATNVIPTIKEDKTQDRQDAYLLVADKSYTLAENKFKKLIKLYQTNRKDKPEEAEEYKQEALIYKFFKDLLQNDGRKICKRPVMVSNYGGTAGGRSEILWHTLRELGVERKWITKKIASKFSKIIGDSITGVLNGGKAFEGYIHQMNNLIAKKNKAVTWYTADGFYVVHMKQKELKAKQVSCMLPGARKPITINKKIFSDKLSSAKMKSAISPNYVHSLDAQLLRVVAMKMRDAGIVNSDWIHDSFGCSPNNVSQMLEITKQSFLELVKDDPLLKLDAQLRSQIDKSKASQKALEKVELPLLGGFDVHQGDLDVLKTSDWFFS